MNKKGGIFFIGAVVLVVAGIVLGYYMFSPNAPEDERTEVISDVGEVIEQVRGNTEVEEFEQEGVIEDTTSGDQDQLLSGSTDVWMNTELTDVITGETFRIKDFNGKPVLLESFAVWCPTCTKQQNQVKLLHDEVGDNVISVALATDPSEDENLVRQHANQNGFDWKYAVSPEEVRDALIDEFGTSIISAPTVPMILICEDGSYRKLSGSGSRNVNKLQQEIAAGCQ